MDAVALVGYFLAKSVIKACAGQASWIKSAAYKFVLTTYGARLRVWRAMRP